MLSAVQHMHVTFKEEVWLWRGEAEDRYRLEPGMHTRVLGDGTALHDAQATTREHTTTLLDKARAAGLDRSPSDRSYPDLALLAHLQHYGAATPLLDVSVDPLIAFWMAVFADADDPVKAGSKDHLDGRILGILRPSEDRWISPVDDRSYTEVAAQSESGYLWYRPPYVAERLRIQRGSFILGAFTTPHEESTLNLNLGDVDSDFLAKRMTRMGQRGKPAQRTAEVICFKIPRSSKPYLRELLVSRSGLDSETVYPIAWTDHPIQSFARRFGRTIPL
ncbi:FRG domain-containing protein [Microbacterium sp. TNHR37B]|uniref:FRG domain-containing protein n=1 Tax=Microbacterium sp. TNHR37B TaxID=1775956 RepID=UPI0018D31515|nr:FRG domain-containing protein [Microbacterium sp. TNHR37B]